MRLLHMTHPDQIDALPAWFAPWVLAFDNTENEARNEIEERAAKKVGA